MATSVCMCVCVSCVASDANAQNAGWAVLKAAVSIWTGEQWRVCVITPGTEEGGGVFIWTD